MNYDYRCQRCGEELEVDATMGTAPRSVPCPCCGDRAVRVFFSSSFSRSSANAEETWNPQLGIAHRNDMQAAEHIKRLNDTEGTHYALE